jgi:hypothetical protein
VFAYLISNATKPFNRLWERALVEILPRSRFLKLFHDRKVRLQGIESCNGSLNTIHVSLMLGKLSTLITLPS